MRLLMILGPRGGGWQVEAPTTFRERGRGLRGSVVGVHQAMLLERCRSIHTIGMSFPITVAFLDTSLRVIRVERTPAGRIISCRRARHVLECHIGADVREGDLLSLQASRGGPAIHDARDSARQVRT